MFDLLIALGIVGVILGLAYLTYQYDKMHYLFIVTGILLIAAYGMVFYQLLAPAIWECEVKERKTMMLPAGKVMIPSQIDVCTKWKEK